MQSLADSAMNDTDAWNGVKYNFVMGVHPHNASEYNDEIENIILKAMEHVSLAVERMYLRYS
jgi:TatD DNase family protein